MAERPTAAELVEAVREFLERDVMGALDGRLAFHTRVALNALGIVARELTLGPEHHEAHAARLRELLEISDDRRNVDALERELAAAIRAGSFDDRFDEVRAALRISARDALLIDNPRYLPPH